MEITPRCIPEKDPDCLYNHVCIFSRAVGGVRDAKEAKRTFFIGAILFYLVKMIDDDDETQKVNILIEESMVGRGEA